MLDLLFGKRYLTFFQNKSTKPLEETDAASKQKSFTAGLFRAVTLFRCKRYIFFFSVFICLGSAEFSVQAIPEAHLFLNSLIDLRQKIAFKAHTLAWGPSKKKKKENKICARGLG